MSEFLRMVSVFSFPSHLAEENRDPFREASGVIRVAPFLRHTDPKIRLMATESLLNLCLTSGMRC